MTAQFDVFKNIGPNKKSVPFVVVVQTSQLSASSRRVVVPLMDVSSYRTQATTISPTFVIEGRQVMLNPLEIVSVPRTALKDHVTSLRSHETEIINAIDALITRAYG